MAHSCLSSLAEEESLAPESTEWWRTRQARRDSTPMGVVEVATAPQHTENKIYNNNNIVHSFLIATVAVQTA